MQEASLIKWKKGGLKAPLARVLGLGAAHGGMQHWIVQRVTGVLSVPLVFWLCWSVLGFVGASHAQVVSWMQQPVNAVLLMATVVIFCYHAALGAQVVIEDYVSGAGGKIVSLIFVKTLLAFVAAVSVFSILKVAL